MVSVTVSTAFTLDSAVFGCTLLCFIERICFNEGVFNIIELKHFNFTVRSSLVRCSLCTVHTLTYDWPGPFNC